MQLDTNLSAFTTMTQNSYSGTSSTSSGGPNTASWLWALETRTVFGSIAIPVSALASSHYGQIAPYGLHLPVQNTDVVHRLLLARHSLLGQNFLNSRKFSTLVTGDDKILVTVSEIFETSCLGMQWCDFPKTSTSMTVYFLPLAVCAFWDMSMRSTCRGSSFAMLFPVLWKGCAKTWRTTSSLTTSLCRLVKLGPPVDFQFFCKLLQLVPWSFKHVLKVSLSCFWSFVKWLWQYKPKMTDWHIGG